MESVRVAGLSTRVHRLERRQLVPRPLEEVFEFFARAANLEQITPPWLRFALVGREPAEMGRGVVINYRLRLHGMPVRWISRIEEWHEQRRFVDRQIRGPYRMWVHEHDFATASEGGTWVHDRVRYALPLGMLGDVAGRPFVERDLGRIFDYRRAAVARLLG